MYIPKTQGWFKIESILNGQVSSPVATIQPRDLGSPLPAEVALRVGNIHIRHSTDPNDLNKIDSMACGLFDKAIIVIYACTGFTETVCMVCIIAANISRSYVNKW